MIKLSILICALQHRIHLLKRLQECLKPQLNSEVEVIIDCDNREKRIGRKRQDLLEKAQGKYITYIDDDDLVSPNYIELVLHAIDQVPDVVGIHLIMTTDKVIEEHSFHSIKYTRWYDEPDSEKPWLKQYYRNPNHLNPVKRELALKAGFVTTAHGTEDILYSDAIKSYLKTEIYIEQPIYFYDSLSRKNW